MEMFSEMVFWHWFVIAIILIVAEIMTMSFFAMFIAMAAVIVGVISWLVPNMSSSTEFIIFSILSLISIVGWHFYRKAHPPGETDQPALNRRGEQYVDRTFTLEEPIVNGIGKLRVDDTKWKIEADNDMKKGDKVKVTAVEGTVLKVEKA